MIITGIDPGKKGSIAEINVNKKLVRWMALPYRDDGMLQIAEIKNNFDLYKAHRIAIEDVCFIHGSAGASTFNFGKNVGMALAMLYDVPYELIRPQAWHKSINGAKVDNEDRDTKARSKASFLRMNPNFGKIIKSKHEGMIDAFFIAYYCGKINSVVMPVGFSFLEVIPS